MHVLINLQHGGVGNITSVPQTQDNSSIRTLTSFPEPQGPQTRAQKLWIRSDQNQAPGGVAAAAGPARQEAGSARF